MISKLIFSADFFEIVTSSFNKNNISGLGNFCLRDRLGPNAGCKQENKYKSEGRVGFFNIEVHGTTLVLINSINLIFERLISRRAV